jgi:hypothetical protein
LHVLLQLPIPVWRVRGWPISSCAAVMPVPETAMYKYGFPATGKCQIGLSRQVVAVEPKAVP